MKRRQYVLRKRGFPTPAVDVSVVIKQQAVQLVRFVFITDRHCQQ